MIEATRMCITRRAAMMAVLAFLTAQSWLGVVPAHGASARPADAAAERELGRGGEAEGRVMEMARDGDGGRWCGSPTGRASGCPLMPSEAPIPSAWAW